MELPRNNFPRITEAIMLRDLLKGKFVVVDVGVYGGEHPRWHVFGERLVVYGFDARSEAIEPLLKQPMGAGRRRYFNCAIGDEDGTREFQVVENVASSSFYESGGQSEARLVPIRRLDSLVADRTIESPDFIKVDVEGFEKYVFLGAGKALDDSVLAVEFETNFNDSPEYPAGHFATIHEILRPRGFYLADMVFDRYRGVPSTFDVLFCRKPRTANEVIKLAIIHDLYGHEDAALDTASLHPSWEALAAPVEPHNDVLLPPSRADEIRDLQKRLAILENSASWRWTAPLRAIRRLFG